MISFDTMRHPGLGTRDRHPELRSSHMGVEGCLVLVLLDAWADAVPTQKCSFFQA